MSTAEKYRDHDTRKERYGLRYTTSLRWTYDQTVLDGPQSHEAYFGNVAAPHLIHKSKPYDVNLRTTAPCLWIRVTAKVHGKKVNRVIHAALLTVIESDITFPADVFSHSGGCHTIPPIPPDILRCHIGS